MMRSNWPREGLRKNWPMLLWLGTVMLLLLLSRVTCSCNPVVDPAPVVVVVEGEQIVKADKEGWWMVTDGWLHRRLEYEQSLQRDIEGCEGEVLMLWKRLGYGED